MSWSRPCCWSTRTRTPLRPGRVLQAIQAADLQIPILAVLDPDGVERYPWHEVVDEFVYPGAPPAEIGLRVALLRRRAGVSDEATIRLGALAIDTESYRVTAQGRPLDLTFKEFELLRFLASRAGRVFTRPALLREVWGYDFYGGRGPSTCTSGVFGRSSDPSTST